MSEMCILLQPSFPLRSSVKSVSIRVHPWLNSLPTTFHVSRFTLSCHIAAMQRRRLIILLLLGCVLSAAGVALVWPRHREPEYAGKKLSEWLLACGSQGNGPEADEAVDAIRHIGTEALPWLMTWRSYQMAPVKADLISTLEKGPLAGATTRAIATSLSRQQRLAAQTLTGYQILGSQARPAIPELTSLMKDEWSSVWAMHALANIGPEGLPALLAALVDPQTAHRSNIPRYIGSLRRSGHDISAAVPVLIRCLGDPDHEVASAAASTLARARRDPRSNPFIRDGPAGLERAVPILTDSLKDPRASVRYAAASTIAMFRDQGRPAVPALIEAMTDSDASVRFAATNALQRIAPEVLTSPELKGKRI